jgi:SpoVK/Ycf46/Vps4 family AAA+-type ATPase
VSYSALMKEVSTEPLEEDHAAVGAQLAQLCDLLDERDVERAFAQLDLVWARLAVHIRAEHLCLFPAILDAARGLPASEGGAPRLDEAQGLIDQLRRDHDFFMTELARAVNLMRAAGSSQDQEAIKELLRDVRRAVGAVTDRLARHNDLEEEQVYRWPAALLDPTEQARLAARVRREMEKMPPRFATSLTQGGLAE